MAFSHRGCLSVRKVAHTTINRPIQVDSRLYQGRMPMSPALRNLAAMGAACLLAAQPFVCYAASNDTISGSADAPSRSEVEGGEEKQPPNFNYTHLWTSKDGETHISECQMKGFILKAFAQGGAPQYTKQSTIEPEKISWTQLPPGTYSPLHSPPGVQYVVDMSGSWYVRTSDGTKRVFQPGEVMFQDNVEDSPAEKQPEHESGTAGPDPCNQMVIQVDRAPEVDRPCPF